MSQAREEEMQQTIITTTTPAISLTAARLALAAGAATILLLAILHLLSPEFDPSTRMVSEYALGSYGWVLSLMFLTWAFSCISLFFAIRSQVETLWGKIGLGFLLLSALGMTLAAFFDVSHSLHGLAALIGIPTLPVAAMLVSVSLLRNPAWFEARSRLLWTANLTWISLVLMFGTIVIVLATGGEFGPNMPVGWPNRFLIVAYCLWTITVAWSAERLRQQEQ
jgi:hypothetical protein